MRLKSKPGRRRKATTGPVVYTPIMARRPRSGDPAPTMLMPAIREAEAEITREMPLVLTSAPVPPSQTVRTVTPTQIPQQHHYETVVLPTITALHHAAASRGWTGNAPDVRTPEQIAAHANEMAVAFDARMAELEQRSRRRDSAIAEFARRWQHDDAHWARVAEQLAAKRDASDAGRIIQAYDEGGTSVALCTVEQVAHEIARRALAGSGVSR